MPDYRNQNLEGRSFRGQNLINADFSGADLRGVDFRNADLSGAKFIGAKTGITWQRRVWKIVLGVTIGGASAILLWVSLLLILEDLEDLVKFIQAQPTTASNLVVGYSYVLLTIFSVMIALRRQNWFIVLAWQWFITAGAVLGEEGEAVAVVASKALMVATALMGGVVGAVVGTGVRVGVRAVTVTVTVAGAVAGTIATLISAHASAHASLAEVVMVMVALVVALVVAGKVAVAGAGKVAVAGAVIWIGFGFYLNWRCLKYEEAMLSALRRFSLAWQCWGGSDFRGATLTNTDFSRTDLSQARFTSTPLVGCIWQNAQNLHLADTRHTLLEPRQVRLLLSEGNTGNGDFSHTNLRGAVLSGLDLSGLNFSHADLSLAKLHACNLSDCDLSEVMALGTDFGEAIFTGAIIENWNIDKTTRFDGAQCRFVYLT